MSVWDFFDRVTGSAEAKCKLCGTKRSLGSTEAKHQTTGNCKTHLLKQHPEEWNDALKKKEGKVEKTDLQKQIDAAIAEKKGQPAITACFRPKDLWKDDHIQSQQMDRKIFEMICIDLQPWSMVEDVGFKNLRERCLSHGFNLPFYC